MGRTRDPNKLSESLIQSIKDSLSRVNNTLNYYEENYVSATRTSEVTDKEPCTSLQEFIEIRVNNEFQKIPELSEALQMCNGHLFICKELINPDPKTRRFDQALISLIEESDIDSEVNKIIEKRDDIHLGIDIIRAQYPELIADISASLRMGMNLARQVLKNCTKFRFNSVKRKIKLTNKDNKKL